LSGRRPRRLRIPHGRGLLRVAEPEWADPLDPGYAAAAGGRWDPSGSGARLYLSGDVATARMRLQRLADGAPFMMDDLDDDAYVLVAATLPRGQACADAVSEVGLRRLGLPASYPLDAAGVPVRHAACQAAGERVREARLRGVWCVSAASRDKTGRELAWFPATTRSRARLVWPEPLPLGRWRDAAGWSDLDLDPQPDSGRTGGGP
jgi:RES domain-containing protein